MSAIRHHLYHHDGVTDAAVMRRDALAYSKAEPVLLHLHEYDDQWDGCPPIVWPKESHELYDGGVRK